MINEDGDQEMMKKVKFFGVVDLQVAGSWCEVAIGYVDG